jgi:hypothetical protein
MTQPMTPTVPDRRLLEGRAELVVENPGST